MKIVINKSPAQFALSGPALEMYLSLSGETFTITTARNNPSLVEVVETMGTTANGLGSELKVVEVADNSYNITLDENGIEQVEQVTPKVTKNAQTPQTNQEPV